MPYLSIDKMPTYTHKYSDVARRQSMHVFNSTYKKVLEETKSTKDAEQRAMMAMNSVLKKRFVKHKESYSHDYINHLVDKYLGNLHG